MISRVASGGVSGADAGAARRHDQVRTLFVAPFDESPVNYCFFVWYDLPADDLHSRCLEHPCYLRTAPILAFSACAPVAYGNDDGLKTHVTPLPFWIRR
jgi:hypothetical protein